MGRNDPRLRCCTYGMTDEAALYRNLKLEEIKEYGEKTTLEDGTVLHMNYDTENWDGGRRSLDRCRRCGALFLSLYSYDYDPYDGYYGHNLWIPVKSEEEADLLNILLDSRTELRVTSGPYLMRADWNYSWVGEGETVFCDPDELRELIREWYEDVNPELLERLIRKAGTEHAAEKKPWKKMEEKKPDPNVKKSYSYLADFSCDPPDLIRLGSFAEMEADRFVYPGVWKDTPRLNDIRVGLGGILDYDRISEKEAMEIMRRNRACFEKRRG